MIAGRPGGFTDGQIVEAAADMLKTRNGLPIGCEDQLVSHHGIVGGFKLIAFIIGLIQDFNQTDAWKLPKDEIEAAAKADFWCMHPELPKRLANSFVGSYLHGTK